MLYAVSECDLDEWVRVWWTPETESGVTLTCMSD